MTVTVVVSCVVPVSQTSIQTVDMTNGKSVGGMVIVVGGIVAGSVITFPLPGSLDEPPAPGAALTDTPPPDPAIEEGGELGALNAGVVIPTLLDGPGGPPGGGTSSSFAYTVRSVC